MAETKKTTKTTAKKTETKKEPAKKETKKTSSSTHISNGNWSLAKVSFVIILAVAILYLISSIFAILGISAAFVTAMQAVCSAAALAVVGFIGWNYVKNRKRDDLKVIYIIALILVLVGIVIPAIF